MIVPFFPKEKIQQIVESLLDNQIKNPYILVLYL